MQKPRGHLRKKIQTLGSQKYIAHFLIYKNISSKHASWKVVCQIGLKKQDTVA